MLSPKLLDEVESFIKENVELGYVSREEFIQDAVCFRLTSLPQKKSPRTTSEKLDSATL